GFDSFGLALALYNEIELDTESAPGVTIDGEGADELPADDSNLVVRALRALADHVGRELPDFSLRCANRIPLERGLGSSAAAIVGGIRLGAVALEAFPPFEEQLGLAVELEGHADNVAAALVGHATIA